jgi:predicted Zn-dependent protease with MMP-like domain
LGDRALKQVQPNDFTENEPDRAKGEQGAHTFFALLCFLVAIIFLSVFLGNALDGISSMLVLLGVIAFGLGGVYLLGQRSSQKNEVENDFPLENSQDEEDVGEGIVEGTVVESSIVQDEEEDEDEAFAEDDTESVEEDEENEDEDEDYQDDEQSDEDEDGDEDEESLNAFKLLVEEALDSIPLEFRKRMENLVVMVEKEPEREVLQRVGTKEGYTLLGLYEGTPLTAQGHLQPMLPERITIYQSTIEAYCHGDPRRICQQVRATLLHEVAHHFGIDHDEMPIWVK